MEEPPTVSHVAIVTDSASDLPPDVARQAGVTVVPLVVSFGAESFRPGVNLTTDEFWKRMTAPDAPFPTTAAAAPGDFITAFKQAFDAGADSVVCVCVSGDLSGTLKAALVAKDQLPDREIHIVDSRSASMGQGMLCQIAAELNAAGVSGAEIAKVLEHRKNDLRIFLALDTLEYLKRGGRISGARAAIGTMLNVKPLITVEHGVVENAERVRSRPKARERVLELLTQEPLERASILHTTNADIEEFVAAFKERSKLDDSRIQTMVVGPSVGPHLGPGCVGGVVMVKH